MSLAQQRWMRWSVSPSRRLAAMSRNRACNRRELIVSCEAPSRCDGIGRRDGLKIRWANHPCGFESHHRHHRRTLIWIQLGSFFFAPLPCEKVLILWAFSASRTRIPARAVSSFMLIQSIFDHLQQNTLSRPTLKSCARWGNRVRDGYFVCEMG